MRADFFAIILPMSESSTYYPSSLREEELKNRVAQDLFGAFDCARIIGNIDGRSSQKSMNTAF